jgi:dipeptidyl aminopeptidase/acylaminoacyl peptidase
MVPAAAQEADTITPYDIARLKYVFGAELAPSGDQLAYTLLVQSDPFKENAPAKQEVHLLNLATGDDIVLIPDSIGAGTVQWTPDGEWISFVAKMKDDEEAGLYVIAPEGGEPIKAASPPHSMGGYDWSPDGSHVAYLASEGDPAKASSLPVKPEVYEEAVSNGKVWITAAFDTAATARMIDHPGTAYQVEWSPDGSKLVAPIAPTPLVDDRYMYQRISVFQAGSGEHVASIDNPGKLGQVAWAPDGESIVMISGIDINDPSEGRLMSAPATGGDPVDLLPLLMGHVVQFRWSDASTLDFIAGVGVGSLYGKLGKTDAAPATIYESEVVNIGSITVNADWVVFVANTPEHPSEIYAMPRGEMTPRRMTVSNPWLAEKRLARQEIIRYTARDGMELAGILIRPMVDESELPVPLVMVVHGGPESHYSNGWLTGYSRPGQTLAAKGMAVFYPNYRGSTGRGVEFSKLSQADPAGLEFDDVVDAVDHLIDIGLVDSARVGVTGGSYGGYATGWMATKYSDRFAAGVMFVGISNKVSKVGTTDILNEEYLVHARKRPWDNWQFFLERSPVYYADQGHTPLLIMHGAEDPRVNPGQSRELYRHLKLRGKAPVRLIFYPGEGHGNRMSAARLDYNLRMLRWMEHYLQGPGGDAPAYEIIAEQPLEVIEAKP